MREIANCKYFKYWRFELDRAFPRKNVAIASCSALMLGISGN
jgi:hypothetical protein